MITVKELREFLEKSDAKWCVWVRFYGFDWIEELATTEIIEKDWDIFIGCSTSEFGKCYPYLDKNWNRVYDDEED